MAASKGIPQAAVHHPVGEKCCQNEHTAHGGHNKSPVPYPKRPLLFFKAPLPGRGLHARRIHRRDDLAGGQCVGVELNRHPRIENVELQVDHARFSTNFPPKDRDLFRAVQPPNSVINQTWHLSPPVGIPPLGSEQL